MLTKKYADKDVTKPVAEKQPAPESEEKQEDVSLASPKDRNDFEKESVIEVKVTEAANAAVETHYHKNPDKPFVLYVTAKPENTVFEIRAKEAVVKGRRDSTKRYILFRVPVDVEEAFKAHKFVKSGRVIRVKEFNE
jgi:hypothetical protein